MSNWPVNLDERIEIQNSPLYRAAEEAARIDPDGCLAVVKDEGGVEENTYYLVWSYYMFGRGNNMISVGTREQMHGEKRWLAGLGFPTKRRRR